MGTEILIADDHGVVRLGASIVIKEVLPIANIEQAENFEGMMEMLSNKHYKLLILDINMPGGNNIQMLEQVLLKQPDLKVLVYSSYDETLYAVRYMQAGAVGYLHKNSNKAQIKDAIETVLHGGKYMSEAVKDLIFNNLINGKSKLHNENPLTRLSNREVEVAQFLIKGLGVQDVSNSLKLSTSTVSTYKNRIFEKLQVNNIPDLIEKFKMYT
ncbi:two component transcriptional regulator, LuxR family [bacterium A37T11]|nr:two component transcriptional regulator, LuxR family [bacterium A37T11]